MTSSNCEVAIGNLISIPTQLYPLHAASDEELECSIADVVDLDLVVFAQTELRTVSL